MLPNFLGIGAARAGSTWVARNLGLHPDVCLPRDKELHFFDRYYDRGIEFYESQFSACSGQSAVGEVTPQYFHNLAVAPRIKETLPAVRLIVCLRNPVERAYSHYWNIRAKSPESESLSFEEKLQQPTEIFQVGYYYDHLMRYYELFPKDQVLVLLYEDLKADPEAFLREIFSFLNVDVDFVSPLAHHKVNVAASHQDLGQSKLLWHFYRVLGRIGAHRAAHSVEKINRRDLPAMRPETREFLLEVYRPKNELLQELIGRDLSSWNS